MGGPAVTTVSERVGRRVATLRADLPLALLDVLVVVASYATVFALVQGPTNQLDGSHLGVFLAAAAGLHLVTSWCWRLYGQLWRYASIAEARRVVAAGVTSGVVLAIVNGMTGWLPQSVVGLGCLLVTGLSGGVRFQARILSLHRRREGRFGRRVLVVGAGEGANGLVRDMLSEYDPEFVPVAIVDDNTRLHGMQLAGVPIEGSVKDLRRVLHARHRAELVVLAVPSAHSKLVERVAANAETASLPVKTVPRVRDLFGARPSVRDVRDLRIEDLLGREQVVTDLEAVRAPASRPHGAHHRRRRFDRQRDRPPGRRRSSPRRLVLLDHDETHLHDTLGHPDGAPSIRSSPTSATAEVVREIFDDITPDVVFHAAAHKHVPLLEDHPCEAVRTNVLGTRNVVDAALRAGVERFVFISTDKAVRPTSVMGASKWLGEQLVTSMAPPGARWCSVRFGNVLGSRGSVIPTFARQIEPGGPVTVTDPRMTRFFMSVRRGRAARAPGRGVRRWPRPVHARDGRAGQHPRTRRAHDPPQRARGG